jgi:hypothetical protein
MFPLSDFFLSSFYFSWFGCWFTVTVVYELTYLSSKETMERDWKGRMVCVRACVCVKTCLYLFCVVLCSVLSVLGSTTSFLLL